MDIHIILETSDFEELNQAQRLLDHLRADLATQGSITKEPFVPVPLVSGISAGGVDGQNAPAVKTKPKSSMKKAAPAVDPKQIDIPGTEEKKPAASPGDYSTPVLAAQSLARSRKDGVASVVALVKEFNVQRVSDLPKEQYPAFLSRAQALAAEPVSS